MSRHNFAFLYGTVAKNPRITMNEETGDFIVGQCLIYTIRGKRSVEDDELVDYVYDCPVIASKNKDILFKMNQLKENDMVFVKGMISTRDVQKISVCPHCHHTNKRNGVLLYVTPIFLEKVENGVSKEKSQALLKEKCEISNQILVTGNLCGEPEIYKSNKGMQVQYQLALNRKFRVKEDPPEIKTDYPWVKSTGKNAENDALFLKTGATVLVEGYLQTRTFKQTLTCENCGEQYETDEQTLEIGSYSTEYMMGCNTVAEIEEKENQIVDDVLNSLKN